jgi:hypothetical protein
MKEYIEFVWEAIFGTNPDRLNSFYLKNKNAILNSASLMRDKFPIENTIYYRGVILNPNKILGRSLEPVSDVHFISFTEDRKVAEYFADKNSEVSRDMARNIPNATGYLIEHQAELSEILFHHSWTPHLGLHTQALLHSRSLAFGRDAVNLIESQKEVILEQRGKSFTLFPHT